MKIVQISSADNAGGAERSALNLHRSYLQRGINSQLVVGRLSSEEKAVIELGNDLYRNYFVKNTEGWIDRFDRWKSKPKGIGRALRLLKSISEPSRAIGNLMGIEDFSYPGTAKEIPRLCDADIVHCHNLHGRYFDLRVLPEICRKTNVILNVRDSWLLTGHCALPMECQKWKSGCGKCPDLSRYPAIQRDATAFNWQRKKKIFKSARFFVTAPSQWMLNKSLESYLSDSVVESRVIPNGYDEKIFFPGDQAIARKELGLPLKKLIFMTAGFNIKRNAAKDFESMQNAVSKLAKQDPGLEATFIVLGGEPKTEREGRIDICYIGYINDPTILANYYRASDIYFHSSLMESFGNVLMEAKACGCAIVSTAAGGIPEHILSLDWSEVPDRVNCGDENNSHGLLTRTRDPESMAKALHYLLSDNQLMQNLGKNAEEDARKNFTLEIQTRRFVRWYEEILNIPVDGRNGN